MDEIKYSKEYEIDGSYFPNHIEDNLRDELPDAICEHYQDTDENISNILDTLEPIDIWQYTTVSFEEPNIEHNRYGDLTVLTATIVALFDINRFKRDHNII